GAIVSSALFALLVGEVFFRFPPLADYLTVITGTVLVMVLLFFPGGIGALGEKVAPRLRTLGPRLAHGADAVWNRMPLVRAGRGLVRGTTSLGAHIAALFTRLVPKRAARADSAERAAAD